MRNAVAKNHYITLVIIRSSLLMPVAIAGDVPLPQVLKWTTPSVRVILRRDHTALRSTAQVFFKFVIKWDFTESLYCTTLIIQYFVTIHISVATCEGSFSKQKLIKNYLQSTMNQERLINLPSFQQKSKLSLQLLKSLVK